MADMKGWPPEHYDDEARRSGHSKLVYDKTTRTIIPVRDDMLSDQEVRACALECAAALAAPSATWRSLDVLKLAYEFEVYIRNGKS